MASIKFEKITNRSFWQRIFFSGVGILVNVILAHVSIRFGLPFYMDTMGTIAVSAAVGLFPGILTAVASNAIMALIHSNFIYFGFLNAIIAIATTWFVRNNLHKKIFRVIVFIFAIGFVTGSISSCISWFLLDGAQAAKESETVMMLSSSTGMPVFLAFLIFTILIEIFDKGLAVVLAWFILLLLPDKIKKQFEKGDWKQRPLNRDDLNELRIWGKGLGHSLQRRATAMIILTSVLLVVVTGWSGVRLYFSKYKGTLTVDAYNSLKLLSEMVNKDDLKRAVISTEADPSYKATQALIKKIIDSFESVQAIHLVKFGEKEGRVIFDVEPLESVNDVNGAAFEYDEALLEVIPELVKGEDISPIEHGTITDWKRSVFYPIRDDNGEFICYAIADVSVTYMADYMQNFTLRFFLIFLGFFILVISNNMWFTNVYMSYPIRSMAKCVDDFAHLGYEQEQLDNNVKTIRSLEIQTSDELEKLYDSICNMTLNISDQIRDLRKLSEATLKMQDGLIITMADMVEKRDSDTGEHIQKTALYVKIIVEGLKKKGYYAEKITPKFMSDVVRSAPLHDIGKINIPDGILNKPGKLTPEEFEIMKTHTTAGKNIMENAISTVEGENYLKEARNMAAYHHERWDGKGYPEGLHGEVIPLSARIMAVADVFDALTSPRVYKPAFSLEKSIDIITEEKGKQFDPKCVEVFLEALPDVKAVLNRFNT
jgi:HD-GYP domain-containing protein (c-di-GMP phosphodiesterase class II)